MEQLGFLYDTTRCIGCKACQVACKEKNKLGTGDFFRRVETIEVKNANGIKWVHFSGACNHCKDPACVAVCPTGAMYVAEDGTVQHNDELCVGCGRCVHHCPYGAPSLNKVTGYAQKCSACYDLRQKGRNPACVDACPTRALYFGSIDQLKRDFSATSSNGLPFLPPSNITNPSLLLRRADCHNCETDTSMVPASNPASRVSASAQIRNTDEKFLILGGGASAVSAAKAIRARNETASIRIVSNEKYLPYCRPMLSKGYLNSFSIADYNIVDHDWMNQNHIELELGRAGTELDIKNKMITLDDGRSHSFDKCIYALGANSFVPPIAGSNRSGVFTLRTERDLLAIRRQMLTAKNAVVIGGGITGLEIAWEIKKAGLHVTVLDLAPMLMGRLLDAKSSSVLRNCIEQAGVSVVTDIKIKEIAGISHVESVILDDGTEFPAELVVLSTGFRANIDLAQKAGLTVNKAVAVNSAMETSCKGIFACGDCVDLGASTWMQSVQQGEIAGANAAGDTLFFQKIAEPAMVHTAGTSLISIGDMGKQPDQDYRIVYGAQKADATRYYVNEKTSNRRDSFYAFAFSARKIVGATLIGNLAGMLFIQDAVQQQWDETAFLEAAAKKGIEIYAE